MNMPGFTAELSLVRKGSYYGRYTAHGMAITEMIQPALRFINVPRAVCYCTEYAQSNIAGYDCVQVDCVRVPVFVAVD